MISIFRICIFFGFYVFFVFSFIIDVLDGGVGFFK